MRRMLLVWLLCGGVVAGCEANVDEGPAAALGLDIELPDGASLALDVGEAPQVAPRLAGAPSAAVERALGRPAARLARRQGVGDDLAQGYEKPALRVATDDPHAGTRKYHLAWVRVSVGQPDGSKVVSEFHRARTGGAYWAQPDQRVVPAGDAVPVPE